MSNRFEEEDDDILIFPQPGSPDSHLTEQQALMMPGTYWYNVALERGELAQTH